MRCILIDTIYKIQEQEILPAFYVDFGDKKIPADLFENVNNVLDIAKGIKKNNGVSGLSYSLHGLIIGVYLSTQ